MCLTLPGIYLSCEAPLLYWQHHLGPCPTRVEKTSSDGLVPGGDEIINVGPSLWASCYRAMNDGGKRVGEATEHVTYLCNEPFSVSERTCSATVQVLTQSSNLL